jgi:hypothetical protein
MARPAGYTDEMSNEQRPASGANTDDETIVEPENSTVDDWFGQDVERDTADAERAMREAGGDPDRAEDIFEANRRPHEADRYNVPAEDRPD